MKKTWCILIALVLLLQFPFAVLSSNAAETTPVTTEAAEPVTTGPEEPITTGPEEPITTGPEEPINTGPEEPVTTGPEEPVTTGPEEPVTTEPTEPVVPTEPTEPEPEPRPDEHHGPYISGKNDGSFRPNADISRAELAVILYSQGSFEDGGDRFPDVNAGAWYGQAVNALAAAGILSGYTDGTFRPLSPVTRAQLAAVMTTLSGETASGEATFSDVSQHWARRYIALAQSKGWVAGYKDGTFRPNRNVTRAEAVVMLNQFYGRTPDYAAIASGEGLRYFPDVQPGCWYYAAVMEAATDHTAHYETNESPETWVGPGTGALNLRSGFYCINTDLFAVENGAFVRIAGTRTLNGQTYTCAGSSGICRAPAEVLRLANGQLIFLTQGKPWGEPGTYEDGLYLRAGHLYAVADGSILQTAGTGTADGVDYTCTGASGRCEVEDWNRLSLEGVDLSVFSDHLTPEASATGSDNVTIAMALKAAVKVYETYFHVEYPIESDNDQAYIDKALEYGILENAQSAYSVSVKRGNVLVYLWKALRGRDLNPINTVEDIPDVGKNSYYYSYLMDLYKAGVYIGIGSDHNAQIYDEMSVQELAELLTRLENRAKRQRVTITLKVVKSIQYGTSGSGNYALTAWQIGNGKNVMVLTFALHGWEDNWNRDGEELVYLADQVKSWLESNYDLVTDGDWKVYILRCLNPDGLYLGTTCNGPGRCTTTYYNSSGQLVSGRGIDMNRCFPYCFSARTNDRNFNGSSPLACAEAKALASFVQKVKGSGFNICIDTHGWFSQIITSSGKGTIYNAFLKQFSGNSYASLYGASGYFTSWAAYVQGYDSCLLELPSGIYSHSNFLAKGCVWRYENAIKDLLQHYNGPTSTKSAGAAAEPKGDDLVGN